MTGWYLPRDKDLGSHIRVGKGSADHFGNRGQKPLTILESSEAPESLQSHIERTQRRNCTFAGCVVLLHYVPHTPPLPLGLREQWSDLSRDPRGEKQLVGVGAPLGEPQPRPSGNVLPWCRATALSWHLVSSGFDLERVGYPFWVRVFEVEQTVKGWGPVRNK